MNKFGSRSWESLNSGVHAKLIAVATLVAKKMDFMVTDGQRGEIEQNNLFKKGFSKLEFPLSAHNKSPSRAIDVAPYPIDWEDLERFQDLRNAFYEAGKELGVDLKPVIKFRDGSYDYPHLELADNE